VAAAEIVAFDVDRTLTRRDCVVPFLGRVAGWMRLAAAVARAAPLLVAATRDRERRDDVKVAMARMLLAGRALADVEAEGERFAAEIERRWLRPDVVRRLSWHREAGHEVVLVTASFAVYVAPLGRRLGVDRVVATELEVHDGRLTGRLAGANCRGEEKVRRLAALFGDPPPLAWAYGDSQDDRPLLAAAAHPVLVDGGQLEPSPA
jgi:phosphatidylglycerophosphatase C